VLLSEVIDYDLFVMKKKKNHISITLPLTPLVYFIIFKSLMCKFSYNCPNRVMFFFLTNMLCTTMLLFMTIIDHTYQ